MGPVDLPSCKWEEQKGQTAAENCEATEKSQCLGRLCLREHHRKPLLQSHLGTIISLLTEHRPTDGLSSPTHGAPLGPSQPSKSIFLQSALLGFSHQGRTALI